MQDEANTEGLTFIINKIEVDGAGGSVTGWFMYYSIQVMEEDEGSYERLVTDYLTPYREPTKLLIKRFLFDDNSEGASVTNLEIGPKEIYQGLINLFNLGYGELPSPQVDIPLHNIPPSQRQELVEAQRLYS